MLKGIRHLKSLILLAIILDQYNLIKKLNKHKLILKVKKETAGPAISLEECLILRNGKHYDYLELVIHSNSLLVLSFDAANANALKLSCELLRVFITGLLQ